MLGRMANRYQETNRELGIMVTPRGVMLGRMVAALTRILATLTSVWVFGEIY
jgi:hypothetical protein